MKNLVLNATLFSLVASTGCTDDYDTATLLAASLGTPSITTDSSTYEPDKPIQVIWDELPGNATDWVALAPAGSGPMTVTNWISTAGNPSSDYTFSGLPQGTFVARAFSEDSYNLIVESDAFQVAVPAGSAVATGASDYPVASPIDVSWSGLPGFATDWVALAPAGSSPSTVIAYVYTGGVDGAHTFTGLPSGAYVVRAFPNDTYTIFAEAPFTVGAASPVTLAASQAGYSVEENVDVTWSGMTTDVNNWIAIAPYGSPMTEVARWMYTGGASTGSTTFAQPSSFGVYVVRSFAKDSYALVAESAPFVFGSELATGAAHYQPSDQVSGSFSNFPASATLVLAPAGSPMATSTQTVPASGATGSFSFDPAPAGTYVVRAFLPDASTAFFETAAFDVSIDPSVAADHATYAVGEIITASWSSLPPSATNWIAIAPAGSATTTVSTWRYTDATDAGSMMFAYDLAPGDYVIRAFANDSYTMLDESPAFHVE